MGVRVPPFAFVPQVDPAVVDGSSPRNAILESSRLTISVTDLPGWRRLMRVTVPRSVVKREEDRALSRLAQRARVKGFRKGRLPDTLVRSRYGEIASEDARDNVIENAYRAALRERGLKAFGPASVCEVSDSGGDLEFSVEFDVEPEVKVGRSGGFVIERPVIKVTERTIDQAVEAMRKTGADATAGSGDPVGSADGGGSSAADPTRIDDERVPDESVHEATVSDEDLFAAAGVAGLDELRERLREQLEKDAVARAEGAVVERLRNAFIEANPFDPPKGMVDDLVEHMVPERDDLDKETLGQVMAIARSAAESSVKASYLFEELARTEGLEADNAEVERIVGAQAKEAGADRAEFLKMVRRGGNLDNLRRRIMEHNVLRYIRDRSQIIDEQTATEMTVRVEP